MDALVAEDASLSREADEEEANNASYRSEDGPDEEGPEKKEENVMEEEEQLIIEPQIDTSTNTTSEESSTTHETSCEESTSFSKSEKHVTSSSIDKSEVDRLRELNERLGKTIAFLEKQNESLRVKVERLTRKKSEISSISLEEEESNRAEEIEVLEEKNKSLNQSLENEINVRIEAEKKLGILEREQEKLKLEIKKLNNTINRKEKTISKLKEINETTLETTEITRKGGSNVDTVDGIGIDLEELRKSILKSAEENFTDTKTKYKTKVEELKKTVDEKEAELAEARRENSDHKRLIDNYESEISSFKEKLEKAETRHSEEISRLNKEIQKSKEEIKAMEEKIEIHSQTVKETTKMELNAQLIIYKTYLDRLESRFKKHETEKSAGGEEILKTTKKTEMETKHFEAYSHQEIHHSQKTETSVSQQEEAEKQGQGGIPGTMRDSQGWNGTKDWSEHFKERQNLQNPDSTLVGQTESDPEADSEKDDQGQGGSPGTVGDDPSLQIPDPTSEDQPKSDPESNNEEDDQGRTDNDGDDSDENNSSEILVEVPRDAIPRRQPRFAFIGTRSEFFEQ
uniref:Desmin n=1 Tax=Fundulus heteroclitus TaxID=8078 RepID=A0A147AFC6_FUNHE